MNKSLLIFLIVLYGCKHNNESDMQKHTNDLIRSTSPYLLQHAHNPVQWKEWGKEALDLAKQQDKPILVSIGYSSCHWCHVMEKESFEDTAVAAVMNKHFINIKVDREERPDVDQIYMDAVQAMGLQGGWPLNVFLTPDQKPFYGGTYFPKKGWVNLLNSIAEAFEKNRKKIDESAEAFTQSLQLKESEKYKLEGTDHTFDFGEMDSLFQKLSLKFDTLDGGIKKSPKFPMPSVWQYLAAHGYLQQDEQALTHLAFTLTKIANGGIYDHIGGGFARYSTDEEWHVPHFEKMLYDNGQLLSLYANAFKITQNQQYRDVIMETVRWIEREMLDKSGGFYAALDADSEGEEGKYYVWTAEEIKALAGEDYNWLAAYFDVQENGNWEGKNALRVVKTKNEIAKTFELSMEAIDEGIQKFKQSALKQRNERVAPGLDNKIIAGWNGLALTGLCDAYQAMNDPLLLTLARKNAHFIKEKLIKDGKLMRFPNKDMEGFLEDYAAVIQSFIKYYETTLEYEFIEKARLLMTRANEAFYDESEQLYYFTAEESEALIARKKELFDNVIPSSNSMMAWNLVHLGTHLYDDDLTERGKTMVAQVKSLIEQEPEYLSNWAMLALELSHPFAEIVIVGPKAEAFTAEINKRYLPNKIITGTESEREQAPFEFKTMMDEQTTIYVCYNKACKLPVTSVEEAFEQMK
ncbi:MAG: thioredoxin domain-containing protein [Ekhidna sp.]